MTGETLEHSVITKSSANPIIIQNWNDTSAAGPNFDGLQRRIRTELHKRTHQSSLHGNYVVVDGYSETDVLMDDTSLYFSADPTWNGTRYQFTINPGAAYINGTRFEYNVGAAAETLIWTEDPAGLTFPCFLIVYATPANVFIAHHSIGAANTVGAAVLDIDYLYSENGLIPSAELLDVAAANGWIPLALVYKHAHDSAWTALDDFYMDYRPRTQRYRSGAGDKHWPTAREHYGNLIVKANSTGHQYEDAIGASGYYDDSCLILYNQLPASSQTAGGSYAFKIFLNDNNTADFGYWASGANTIRFYAAPSIRVHNATDNTYVRPAQIDLNNHWIEGATAALKFTISGTDVFGHDGTDVRIYGADGSNSRRIKFQDTTPNTLMQIYANDAATDSLVIADAGGTDRHTFYSDGSAIMTSNLTVGGTLSVSDDFRVYSDGDIGTDGTNMYFDEDGVVGFGVAYLRCGSADTCFLSYTESTGKIFPFDNANIFWQDNGEIQCSQVVLKSSVGATVNISRYYSASSGNMWQATEGDFMSDDFANNAMCIKNVSGAATDHGVGVNFACPIPYDVGLITAATIYYNIPVLCGDDWKVEVYKLHTDGTTTRLFGPTTFTTTNGSYQSDAIVVDNASTIDTDNEVVYCRVYFDYGGVTDWTLNSVARIYGVKLNWNVDKLY